MMMSQIKAIVVPYRGMCGTGSTGIYDGNNCQTAHPTRAPPPTRYRYSTAIRGYINDDESTVLGTDGRFAGSRDTMA